MAEGLDYIGIGIGPANLSFAALAEPVTEITGLLFDQQEGFSWHPGMLLPGATIQVRPQKDLVTLVDPTSPYSFLAFLSERKRLYRFLVAGFQQVLRAEFNEYYQWASSKISSLRFGVKVTAVDFCERSRRFMVETSAGRVEARNVVLGLGREPFIPEACRASLGPTVLHASDFLAQRPELGNKRVVVVGGGQTGAEVFLHLLSLIAADGAHPAGLTWVSRRSNFAPLDDSPFTNELFFPTYAEYFYSIPEHQKDDIIHEQVLASDGIDMATLEEIYRRLYITDFLLPEKAPSIDLLPGYEVDQLRADCGEWLLSAWNPVNGQRELISADLVLLCTGYRECYPDCLVPLRSRIPFTCGQFQVTRDHSIEWAGAPDRKIYLNGAARRTWGIADPNLSLMSWRSAKIVNSLSGYPLYDLDGTSCAVTWSRERGSNASLLFGIRSPPRRSRDAG